MFNRQLSTAVAALTSLGTLMFALAQDDLRLAVAAVAAGAGSVYFTDRKGWIVLNTLGANLAGVAAIVVTLWDWQRTERELLFIALANLLVYLQCILHFRRKEPRLYWMLILLSFLQVAVAAVLNSSVSFGCLLVVYVFVAMRALALFSIYREYSELCSGPTGPHGETPGKLSLIDLLMTPLHKLAWRLLRPRRRHTDSLAQVTWVAAPPARWPLADEVAAVVGRCGGAPTSENCTHGLWPHVWKSGLFMLLLAPLFFALLPRPGQGDGSDWGAGGRGGARGGASLMGFTEDISLQTVTRIQDNPEEVLRISFSRYEQGRVGETYELREEPWLGGITMGQYAWGRWAWGMWVKERYHSQRDRVLRDLASDRQNDLVLQEITLEPMRNSSALFRVDPSFALPGQARTDIRVDPSTGQLSRPEELQSKVYTYQLLTDGFKNGWQMPFRPERRRYNQQGAADVGTSLSDQQFTLLTPFGKPVLPHHIANDAQRRRLSGLKRQADVIVAEKRLDPLQNPRETAQALNEFLSESGLFSYTLEPPPQDPSTSDPIEDFVVRGRMGHCEYFASALTLMLRSQGIPARVVVGYKGGEWNAVGGYYVVRQRNAHAWVEAWILENGRPVGWLRLDPTPSGQVAEAARLPGIRQMVNYVQYLWLRYVLSMDGQLQRDTLIEPAAALLDKTLWQGWFAETRTSVGNSNWRMDRWANWNAAVVATVAAAGLAGIGWLVRWVRRRRLSLGSRQRPKRQPATRVEFYEQLERLLLRLGLRRLPGQTPREFAQAAGEALASQAATRGVCSVPPRVAEAYYRLRYGGEALGAAKAAEVNEALEGLDAAVTQARRG